MEIIGHENDYREVFGIRVVGHYATILTSEKKGI